MQRDKAQDFPLGIAIGAGAVIGGEVLSRLFNREQLKNNRFTNGTAGSPDYWGTYNPEGGAHFQWQPGQLTVSTDGARGVWQQILQSRPGRSIQVLATGASMIMSGDGVDPGVGIVIDQFKGTTYLGGFDTVKQRYSFRGNIGGVFQLASDAEKLAFNLVIQNVVGTVTFTSASLVYR